MDAGALIPTPHPFLKIPSMGEQLMGKTKLAMALVKAIQDCQAVAHDSTNTFHKYKYTSAEAIIEAARNALSKNGIAVIPVQHSINGTDREGPDRFELAIVRMIIHAESGEAVYCQSSWPIIPDKGRPLDKAAAAADTQSLRYFMRGLLQIPCPDTASVENRDDSQYEQQKPRHQEDVESDKRNAELMTAWEDKIDELGRPALDSDVRLEIFRRLYDEYHAIEFGMKAKGFAEKKLKEAAKHYSYYKDKDGKWWHKPE